MMKQQHSTTRLPRALLEELGDKDGGTRQLSGRRTKGPKRRDARKQGREEKKQRKAEFFSSVPSITKPPPSNNKRATLDDDIRPIKKARVDKIPDQSPFHLNSTSLSKPRTIKHVTFDTAPEDKSIPTVKKNRPSKKVTKTQTPLEKLVARSGQAKGPIGKLKGQRSQQEKDEDDEIAWLEGKLRLQTNSKRGGPSHGSAFEDDGLDELLGDLDRLVPSREEPIDSSEEETGEEETGDEETDDDLLGDSKEGSAKSTDESPSGEESDGPLLDWEGIVDDNSDTFPEENLPPPSEPEQSAGGRYIPPHLRTNQETQADTAKTEDLQKLKRKLHGQLNRLSEQNIASIVSEIEVIYRDNRRNDVTTTLTSLILDTITSHSTLLDTFVILYAAFVSSLHKIIGIEFAAHFVQTLVSQYEGHYSAAFQQSTLPESSEEQSSIGKEASNLLVLLSELYTFQVISCTLVYDVIRALLDSKLEELEVELLLKLLKNSGTQLRQDDPAVLKDIVGLVQTKMAMQDPESQSSRHRFMIETLANLKNNKIGNKKTSVGQQNFDIAADAVNKMKKFLGGLSKKQTIRGHEPLNITLNDLHSADKRGKWWLVGSAWAGNPLIEQPDDVTPDNEGHDRGTGVQTPASKSVSASSQHDTLIALAKKQGMNTDVRRSIFIVLMSSDDYVDACERLGQLSLTEIQQREIIRVILHCCANEKVYNPYYAVVVQRLCQFSHSHKITLQYCLWDFLREIGETSAGGQELMKTRKDDFAGGFGNSSAVPKIKTKNLARAYAWWIATSSTSLFILKPLDFLALQPQTVDFLKRLVAQVIVSSQTASPALDVGTKNETEANNLSRDREVLEAIAMKGARHPGVAGGLLYLLGDGLFRLARSTSVKDVLDWGIDVMRDALRGGGDVVNFD